MLDQDKRSYLTQIPSVDYLLRKKELQPFLAKYPRNLIVESIQEVINKKRNAIITAKTESECQKINLTTTAIITELCEIIDRKLQRSLQRVINATGVILHTGLGRALLSAPAIESLQEIGSHFSSLEINLQTGERESRYHHLTQILKQLTNAESALIVNNNAGAVLLVLNTLADGKEVIVSRGELIEIGGAFRLPEVLKKSGAKLVEVGTTNRTYLHDYENAITDNTALLLKSHTSNYRIVGFSTAVSIAELNELGKRRAIPTMIDLGSGLLTNLATYGLNAEPTIQETISAGIDIITFSGDKLLGGPQAGIILGKEKYISQCQKNALLRALRVDKLTIAALESTLRVYLYDENVHEKIPVLQMISLSTDELKNRAELLAQQLQQILSTQATVEVSQGYSQVGGGSLPDEDIPTYLVTIKFYTKKVDEIAKQLRLYRPVIITRIAEDKILLDLRTILVDELPIIVQAMKQFK